jgi:hypothetical protein
LQSNEGIRAAWLVYIVIISLQTPARDQKEYIDDDDEVTRKGEEEDARI